jgi:PucR C-terminal helix-turn-helix domain
VTTTYPWGDLPTALGGLLRPGLGRVVEEVITAVRAEVPEYDQPLEGEFGMLISQGVTVALEQFVELLGRDEEVPDLATSEGLGRAEHRAGRTLDSLQSAYRVGARVAWRAMAQAGAAEGVESRTMYQLAEAVFAYIDRLAAASVAGFAEAEAIRTGELQARRHALLSLLAGATPPDRGEVDRRAAEAGLVPPPRQVAALAVGVSDPAQLARRMPSGSIGAALDPVGLVLLIDPDGPGRPAQVRAALRGRRAVLGPSVVWEDASESVRRALLAWPVHASGGLGDAPLARTDDHLLTLLLAASPRLTEDLVTRRLGALKGMTPGAQERATATLRAWLDAHGDVSAAAEVLHVHPQTVRYRLNGVREACGDRVLDDPASRLELALALHAAITFGRFLPGASGRSSISDGSHASDGTPPGNA